MQSDLWDPLEPRTVSSPTRSATCPKALEDLLLGAGERRTAELLAKVDESAAIRSKLAISNILTEPDVLPVPTFVVNDVDADDKTQVHANRDSDASDSGIGSSVTQSEEAESTDTRPLPQMSTTTEQRGLSKYACEQIHKHIIRPILHEEALKDFHPLVNRVPERIGNKQIKTLRDLEKTLIFLAPVSE